MQLTLYKSEYEINIDDPSDFFDFDITNKYHLYNSKFDIGDDWNVIDHKSYFVETVRTNYPDENDNFYYHWLHYMKEDKIDT